jgi:hypothetical protein
VLGADGEAQCFENGANCSFWNIFLFDIGLVEIHHSVLTMEAKAAELLAAFKNPNLSVDSKIA